MYVQGGREMIFHYLIHILELIMHYDTFIGVRLVRDLHLIIRGGR